MLGRARVLRIIVADAPRCFPSMKMISRVLILRKVKFSG